MVKSGNPETARSPQQFWVDFLDPASLAEGEEMKNQILKGMTTLMAILTLTLVTAVASANGQTVSARASIPFDFVVGDKTLPAGDYLLNNATSSTLRISEKQ